MQRVEAEAQQKAAEAAREAAAAAAAMTNGNGVDSSSENEDGVPKIVVDQEFVDEDRDPDEKTEELLKVGNCLILCKIIKLSHIYSRNRMSRHCLLNLFNNFCLQLYIR